MTILTRRLVLRSPPHLARASAVARPNIVNAAATTAEVWFAQGFAKEEDAASQNIRSSRFERLS